MGEKLGQSLFIDNRGGGASIIGTQAIATAAPDGYTIGVVDSAFTINPSLFGNKLPYDTKKNFTPVSLLARTSLLLVVSESLSGQQRQRADRTGQVEAGHAEHGDRRPRHGGSSRL